MTVSTVLQATKASRSRNNTLRDRYAEMEYFPSLSTPLPPTTEGAAIYESYLDGTDDKNDNMTINGESVSELCVGSTKSWCVYEIRLRDRRS